MVLASRVVFLTASNLAYYLLARGSVTPHSLVDGDFLVAEAGRRNRNYKVILGEHPGLFVKQVQTDETQAISTLEREAACYRMAQSNPKFAPLLQLMPRLIDYDSSRHILIVELLPDGENLTEYHTRMQAFPEEIGQMLGRGLGAYHSEAGRMFGGTQQDNVFPRQAPWILSIHRSNEAWYASLSEGNKELIGVVRQQPALMRHLDELQSEWRFEGLLHGDMKWDNCLVFNDGDNQLKLRIVDWELADLGDPLWDTGAVFLSYLTFWIYSMPIVAESTPRSFVPGAAYKLESLQPAMRAFWQAYVAECRLPAQHSTLR